MTKSVSLGGSGRALPMVLPPSRPLRSLVTFFQRTSFVLQNKIPEREREKPRRCLKRMPHSDGASPSRPFSEEDRQWFMEAMQGHTIDSISRMKQISQIMKMPEHLLDSQGVTTSDLEGMLDELQEHVESIDLANGLISYTKHFFVFDLQTTKVSEAIILTNKGSFVYCLTHIARSGDLGFEGNFTEISAGSRSRSPMGDRDLPEDDRGNKGSNMEDREERDQGELVKTSRGIDSVKGSVEVVKTVSSEGRDVPVDGLVVGSVVSSVDGYVADSVAGSVFGSVVGLVNGEVDGLVADSVVGSVSGSEVGLVAGAVDSVMGSEKEKVIGVAGKQVDKLAGSVEREKGSCGKDNTKTAGIDKEKVWMEISPGKYGRGRR
ncbi:hypothetical protein HID58_076871 [Brassica napus]|uniref:Nucleotide exchange factor Fes1 domain-containing protein n=1 Tax=Brassica napus TaxID=3708 RepID=A0ABQ7YPV4_BRANA|nr:hypothetical protein HID58_076871 [Brassica napus]